MENLFLYLLEVNLILLILGAAYYLFLKKETFHQLNRLILLGVIVLAFLLPLIPAPSWSSEIVAEWQEWLPDIHTTKDNTLAETESQIIPIETETPDSSEAVSPIVEKNEPSNSALENPVISTTPQPQAQPESVFYQKWNGYLFLMGVYGFFCLVFFCRFLFQLFALFRIIQQGEQVSTSLIFTKMPTAPFSFGSFIILNPKQYAEDLVEQIIKHEKVHIEEWHTLDILLVECLTILCWFNPMSWQLRKTIRLNLEYIADSAVLRSGINRKKYQYNLLKVSHPDYQVRLANNFNHSLLKNRIIMMNVKKSPFFKLWKYTLLLPLVLVLLLGLNALNAQKVNNVSNPNPETNLVGIAENPVEGESLLGEEVPSEVEDLSDMMEEDPAEVEDLSDMVEEDPAEVEDLSDMVEENPTDAEYFSQLKNNYKDPTDGEPFGDVAAFWAGKENVFVIIRNELVQENFDFMTKHLRDRGIFARFNQMKYNSKGKLTHIKVSIKVQGGEMYEMENYNNGRPLKKPIIFYYTNYGEKAVGMTREIDSNWPARTRKRVGEVDGLHLDYPDKNKGTSYGTMKIVTTDSKDEHHAEEDKPNVDPRNIYVVITQKTTYEELKQLKNALAKEGLYITYTNIDYFDNGLIQRIQIEAHDEGSFTGNVSASFSFSSTDGKVYMYRVGGKFGMGHGNDLKEKGKLPREIKKALNNMEGYIIGSFNAN